MAVDGEEANRDLETIDRRIKKFLREPYTIGGNNFTATDKILLESIERQGCFPMVKMQFWSTEKI